MGNDHGKIFPMVHGCKSHGGRWHYRLYLHGRLSGMSRKAKQQMSAPGTEDRARMVRWNSVQIEALQRQILIAAGHDPSVVPPMPFRFLTLHKVKELLGLSTASIYRGMVAGKIPRPIKIDGITRRTDKVADCGRLPR